MHGSHNQPPPMPPPPGPPPSGMQPDGRAPELQTSVLDDLDLLDVEQSVEEEEAREEDALSLLQHREDARSGSCHSLAPVADQSDAYVRSPVSVASAMPDKLAELVAGDSGGNKPRGTAGSGDNKPRGTTSPREEALEQRDELSRKSWVAASVDPARVPPGKEDSALARGLLRISNDDLQEAALRGDVGLVRKLIDAGCSVNAPMRPESDDVFMTILHVLASKPELPSGLRMIAEILQAEADINARTSLGATPLICACSHNHIGATELLVSNKAQLDPIDDEGYNALSAAIIEEEQPVNDVVNLQIVKLLADAGVDLDDGGDFSPMTEAVRQQFGDMVNLLLDLGAQADGLHEAVQLCPLPIIKRLTEAEANPFSRNKEGKVVMDLAMERRDEDITSLLRDYIGDLQRKQHGHLKTLMDDTHTVDDDDDLVAGKMSSMARGGGGSVRKSLLDMVHLDRRHMGMEDSKLGRQIEKVMKLARRIIKNKYFQGVMFTMLIIALFAPDAWVILDIVGQAVLDYILLTVIFFFVLEFVLQFVGLFRHYVFSFFFWMDLVGIFSVPLDLSWVAENIPLVGGSSGAHDGVVMRAARMVKLGVRAGRFTKLVKLLRFLPGINQNAASVGTAKVITATLNRALSTQVSICIILMVMVLPLFELLRYPTDDHSMGTWMDMLTYTVVHFPNEISSSLADLEEFYSDRAYYPYEVICTLTDGTRQVYEMQKSAPARSQNSITFKSDDGNVEMLLNFGEPHRIDAWCNIFLVIFVIIVMMGSALLLSNAVSGIVMMPLETLLNGVQKMASTIFKSVAFIAAGGDELESQRESILIDGGDAFNETLVLERVLTKLSALSEITVKKSPIDADTLEQMGESDRALLQGYSTGAPPFTNVVPALVEAEDDAAVDQLMSRIEHTLSDVGMKFDTIEDWDLNILDLKDKQRHTVCVCVLLLYRKTSYAKNTNNDDWTLLSNFVEAASTGYNSSKQVPYHNWLHAVDVTLTMFRVMNIAASIHYFTWHERFALIVSAICHDIGHPGVNNPFLIETSHELAVRYNDNSPLENMHCSKLFEISRQPNSSIFGGMPESTFREVRHICVEAILHTDYQHHFAMVKEIQMFYEVNSEMFDLADEMYKASGQVEFPSKEAVEFFRTNDVKKQLRLVFLHFCDVSNPTKSWNQCRLWANMVTNEFFKQGDKEKELGLQVQTLNDRDKVNRPYSQIGFIEFFVAPLALAMARLIPPLQFCTGQLFDNLDLWVKEWAEKSNPKPDADEHAKVLERITKLVGKAAGPVCRTTTAGMTNASTHHKSIPIPTYSSTLKNSWRG